MRCNIIGKGVEITNKVRDRITSKLARLERVFPEDCEAQVTLKVENITHIIEVTIPLKKRLLRAEVKSEDMFAAIDEVVDILESQVVKYKNRLKNKSRTDNNYKDEFVKQFANYQEYEDNEQSGKKIERTKKFALKPMDPEEAVMEMDLLGHNFFVFRNGDSDEVNVVYKRKNGTYGLIEPEF